MNGETLRWLLLYANQQQLNKWRDCLSVRWLWASQYELSLINLNKQSSCRGVCIADWKENTETENAALKLATRPIFSSRQHGSYTSYLVHKALFTWCCIEDNYMRVVVYLLDLRENVKCKQHKYWKFSLINLIPNVISGSSTSGTDSTSSCIRS